MCVCGVCVCGWGGGGCGVTFFLIVESLQLGVWVVVCVRGEFMAGAYDVEAE